MPVAQLIPKRSLGRMMMMMVVVIGFMMKSFWRKWASLPVEVHPGMEGAKKDFLQWWGDPRAITCVCNLQIKATKKWTIEHEHKTFVIIRAICKISTLLLKTSRPLGTHMASDEQGRHCQSLQRPCRRGCPLSSWSRSPRRGSTGRARPDTPATCCWSSGSHLNIDSSTSHKHFKNWCSYSPTTAPPRNTFDSTFGYFSTRLCKVRLLCFGPLRKSLFYIESFLYFSAKLCKRKYYFSFFFLSCIFGPHSNFEYFFTRLCKGKL